MILVKSKTSLSKIHGVGLFTEEVIPRGALVWEFTPNFDLVIDKNNLNKLSEPAKEQVLNYAYISKQTGRYILCSDDSRFFNHQDNPNIKCFVPDNPKNEEDLICMAIKDIPIGVELTCDYNEFDAVKNSF